LTKEQSTTTTRKQYSPKFKARAAVEAIRAGKTLSQFVLLDANSSGYGFYDSQNHQNGLGSAVMSRNDASAAQNSTQQWLFRWASRIRRILFSGGSRQIRFAPFLLAINLISPADKTKEEKMPYVVSHLQCSVESTG